MRATIRITQSSGLFGSGEICTACMENRRIVYTVMVGTIVFSLCVECLESFNHLVKLELKGNL